MSIENAEIFDLVLDVDDNWHRVEVPDLTRANLISVINKQNEIIDKLNSLLAKSGE